MPSNFSSSCIIFFFPFGIKYFQICFLVPMSSMGVLSLWLIVNTPNCACIRGLFLVAMAASGSSLVTFFLLKAKGSYAPKTSELSKDGIKSTSSESIFEYLFSSVGSKIQSAPSLFYALRCQLAKDKAVNALSVQSSNLVGTP